MYIEPQSNILILKNVPLDTTYEHTIYFDSITAQYSYFAGLVKFTYNDTTYIRVTGNRIKVEKNAADLYDCNYIMFQNAAFGGKWFYAYITSVEYIANEVSEIRFELDVMQTWFFDCSPDYCFVEREHSPLDSLGGNLVPEPVELGEYVFNSYAPIIPGMNRLAVIVAIVDVENEAQGRVYDGIYGAATLYAFNYTDSAGINNKVNEYIQQSEAIVSIYTCPQIFIADDIPAGGMQVPESWQTEGKFYTAPPISPDDELDGYKPHNRKLYTYPYSYFHVDNASGSELALRYEFFPSRTPQIRVDATITQPVQIVAFPFLYKGVTNAQTLNTESIQINNFPLCSWAVDSYQAWVAQNAIPTAMNATEALGGAAAMSVMTGNPVPLGASVISQIFSIGQQAYKASIAADLCKGSRNNGNVNAAHGRAQFYGGRVSINRFYAQRIDQFFDMFGYATNRVKIPNRNRRRHWNYVKTVGATVTGSVPCDDMKKICQIYDTGITFWKNGNEVGNYSLDNAVRSV